MWLSAFTKSDRQRGRNLGADGFLTHPCDPDFLLATARSLIRLHKAENDAREKAIALNNAYREQKRISESLQRSLLIQIPDNAYPGIESATFYEAAWDEASVGGDFYDSFTLTGGRIVLIVGDCTGKGIVAATHTAEVKFALRAYLHEHNDPAVALRHLNQFLCEFNSSDLSVAFVAIAVAVVNLAEKNIVVACAGAERPFVLRSTGETLEINADGAPVGAFWEAAYEPVIVPFELGDVLVMITDGLSEARKDKAFLTAEGLTALASERLRGHEPLRVQGQSLIDAARDFSEGKFQDDVCMVIARRII